jgi:hypothetical protein
VTSGPDLYEQARVQVAGIEESFQLLLDRSESYLAWVRTLAEKERSRPQPDPKFLSAVGVQVRYAGSFVDLLQRAAFDDFLHFSDRVIRLKHWQEGTFI